MVLAVIQPLTCQNFKCGSKFPSSPHCSLRFPPANRRLLGGRTQSIEKHERECLRPGTVRILYVYSSYVVNCHISSSWHYKFFNLVEGRKLSRISQWSIFSGRLFYSTILCWSYLDNGSTYRLAFVWLENSRQLTSQFFVDENSAEFVKAIPSSKSILKIWHKMEKVFNLSRLNNIGKYCLGK